MSNRSKNTQLRLETCVLNSIGTDQFVKNYIMRLSVCEQQVTMSIPNTHSHFTLDCSDNPANFFNHSNFSFPSPLVSYHVFCLAAL